MNHEAIESSVALIESVSEKESLDGQIYSEKVKVSYWRV